MEGLLHPVGPEEVRTYWIRRGAVIAVLLALIISVSLMIANLGSVDGSASPQEPPAVSGPAEGEEPVPPVQPATAEKPAPAPAAEIGAGVPANVVSEEAVPVPSRAKVVESQAEEVDESLPPEPSNTFHMTQRPASGTEERSSR